MAGFRQVYTAFPGYDVISRIEGVYIIDITPPTTPLGSGTGVVGVVAEFDDGPFNQPTQIFGGSDLATQFGQFGFTKDGSPHVGATSAQSAGALAPWDGNGFIALRNKRFSGLVVTRVDNSSGSVDLRRYATRTSTLLPPYNLEPAQTITLAVDGGSTQTVTFDAAAAVRTGNSFPGPATAVFQTSAGPTYVDITTEFNNATAADTNPFGASEAIGDSIAIGFPRPFSRVGFSNPGGTQGVGASVVIVWEYWNGSGWSAFTGLSDGTNSFRAPLSSNQIVSWDMPTNWATTAINGVPGYWVRGRLSGGTYTTNPVYGQGYIEYNAVTGFLGGETLELELDGGATNVVTFTSAEQTLTQVINFVNSRMAATVASASGTQLALNSVIRGTAGSVRIVGGTAVTRLGHTTGTTTGTGDVGNIDSVTAAEAISLIEADTSAEADVDPSGYLRIFSISTPGTGTLQISGGTALAGLGLTVDASPVSAATGQAAATVPAGTRLLDTVTSTQWITMEPGVFAANSGGPVAVRVRPLIDDDTAPTAAIGSISSIVDTLDAPYAVTNTLAISRPNAAQVDAAYSTAFDSTLDINGPGYIINIMFAGRHTENIKRFGRDNALTATATGHKARKFICSPPIGTSRVTARGLTGVGVGNTRSQRLMYVYPAVTTYIPEIARRTSAGGTGFNDIGVIQVTADSYYASVRSLLPPEEDAGQNLGDTNVGALNVLGLEDAFNPEVGGIGLQKDDYIAFKAAGIIAPRFDRVAGMIFQSDVTSVDPAVDSAVADANRRFMADFIIDSLFDIAVLYVKKLNKPARRRAYLSSITAFLSLLLSEANPELSRIEDFELRDDTTDALRGAGFQINTVRVRTYSSMKYIVLNVEVGSTVTIEEAA